MPCLEPECHPAESRLPPADELCAICFTSELKEEACVQLKCGHVFHANCVLKLLKHRWNTLKISFNFACCPACKAPIEIEETSSKLISAELRKVYGFKSEFERFVLAVAKDQGLEKEAALLADYNGNLL